MMFRHVLCYTDTYKRCRSELNSYNYYCYVILADTVPYMDVGNVCDRYGGLLMWFGDDSEIEWLENVLSAYSIECIHIGNVFLTFE